MTDDDDYKSVRKNFFLATLFGVLLIYANPPIDELEFLSMPLPLTKKEVYLIYSLFYLYYWIRWRQESKKSWNEFKNQLHSYFATRLETQSSWQLLKLYKRFNYLKNQLEKLLKHPKFHLKIVNEKPDVWEIKVLDKTRRASVTQDEFFFKMKYLPFGFRFFNSLRFAFHYAAFLRLIFPSLLAIIFFVMAIYKFITHYAHTVFFQFFDK